MQLYTGELFVFHCFECYVFIFFLKHYYSSGYYRFALTSDTRFPCFGWLLFYSISYYFIAASHLRPAAG